MKLDFALCVNDVYAKYISVTIKSICENHRNNPIVIHVLTDFISESNQSLLHNIVRRYDKAELDILTVDDTELRDLKDTWSIYTWYRVLIPALLPDVERCLYLDADTVVTDNLSSLFALNMDDVAIACAIDTEAIKEDTQKRCNFGKDDIYVCAGVMLMNLKYWRENNLSSRIIKWGRENDSLIKFPDQDTINILCKNNKIVLPIKYGVQHIFYYNQTFLSTLPEELLEAYRKPAIIHYAGFAPWIRELSDTPFHHYWERYNNLLSNKVKIIYQTKGVKGMKVRIWRAMHPYALKKEMTLIEEKISLSDT